MKPHPVLSNRYTTPDERPRYVNDLFNEGAVHYDPVVHWGFFGTGNLYRRIALRRGGLKPGMRLLDVASGTGLTAVAGRAVLGEGADITCVEPSEGMAAVARKKLDARFVKSGAESMPLEDAGYDFLTVGYALRHFEDLEATFREFHRVLRPGGRVVLLEATRPESKLGSALFRFYFGQLYPFVTRLLTGSKKAEEMMVYFWETMDTCVRPKTVCAALEAAGFTNVNRYASLCFSEYRATKL